MEAFCWSMGYDRFEQRDYVLKKALWEIKRYKQMEIIGIYLQRKPSQ